MQYFFISRNYITFILAFTIILFLLNNVLEFFLHIRGYYIGFSILIFGLLSNSIIFNKEILIFYIFFLLRILIDTIICGGIYPTGYLEMLMVTYITPYLVYTNLHKLCDDSRIYLIKFISFTCYISLIGSLIFIYYTYNLNDLDQFNNFFQSEITISFGDIVTRNVSIYGGSLAAASIFFAQFLSSLYLHRTTNGSIYFYNTILTFLLIISTYSRRSMIPALLVLFFYLIFIKRINYIFLLSIFILFYFILFIFEFNFLINFINRFAGSLDFMGGDISNLSRLEAISNGFMNGIIHPFGSGLGSSSSIGKSVENINLASNFIGVTESFYATLFSEFGFIYFFIIITWIIFLIKNNTNLNQKIFFIFPVILESVMGLGLINPIFAILFYFLIFCSLKNINKK